MKNKIILAVEIIISIVIFVILVVNFIFNFSEFWKASISQILTLAVAIGIAFWASQYKNDQRKSKEHIQSILMKLQQIVLQESFYIIPSNSNQEEILKTINSTNRRINNCLSILEEYSKVFEFTNEMEYIKNEFNTYKTKIGDHITDLEYLSKTEEEFKRVSNNIDSKCDFIIFSLYK